MGRSYRKAGGFTSGIVRAKSSCTGAVLAGTCALLAATLSLAGCSGGSEGTGGEAQAGTVAAQTAGQPLNVVIFLIDTLRADRLGCYGYEKPTSPFVDTLARQGVVFEQASAPAPWTLPSVVSILTSTPVCEHGVLRDGQRIAPGLTPLAERMKALGYATGSFYANPYAGPVTGLSRGFDVCQQIKHTTGQTVSAWLKQVGDAPLFLYIHNTEPHNPWEARDPYIAPFGTATSDLKQQVYVLSQTYRKLTRVDFKRGLPLGTTDNTAQQQELLDRLTALKPRIDVLYDATVLEADMYVGSVVDALQRAGRWDNTLFFVIADHGEEMAEHGGWQHDQSVYEELIRVPLVVRFPGDAYAGRRITEPVSLIDILPTVAEVLGRPQIAQGARGRNLMPLIEGDSSEASMQVTAMRDNRKKFFRPYKLERGDRNVVVRDGMWKAIWNAEIETLELYDLSRDPREQRDLADADPERAEAMRAYAVAYLEACAAGALTPDIGAPEDIDEEALSALRTLGYVGGDEEGEEQGEKEDE